MRMLTAAISILLVVVAGLCGADAAPPAVLVDTDAACDDLRAICLLLGSGCVDILGIVTSDGALVPASGLTKVQTLLGALGRSDIPTAAGRPVSDVSPPWRSFCETVPWGDPAAVGAGAEGGAEAGAGPGPGPGPGPGLSIPGPSAVSSETAEVEGQVPIRGQVRARVKDTANAAPVRLADGSDAARLLIGSLAGAANPVTIVCLGALTNVAEALMLSPGVQGKLSRVVWYNDSVSPPSGTNYERDRAAADFLLESDVLMDVVSNPGGQGPRFDETLLGLIDSLRTPCAERVAYAHHQPEVMERVRNGHLRLWDDLVAVYVCHPDVFDMEPVTTAPRHRINRGLNAPAVRKEIVEMLAGDSDRSHGPDRIRRYGREPEHERMHDHGHSGSQGSVIFREFPSDSALFREDLGRHAAAIIARHGSEEWRVCALTSEMHHHLGIYAIIGAKMGLRAREILSADADELRVVSWAGLQPPLSCLNDGLQVSTGSTLGHGSIEVLEGPGAKPEARFSGRAGSVTLRLKSEYARQVRSDIARGIEEYGDLTEAYFDFVRRLAIRYWLEWERREMFEVARSD